MAAIVIADEQVIGPIAMSDTQMENMVAAGTAWGKDNRHEPNVYDYSYSQEDEATDKDIKLVESARPGEFEFRGTVPHSTNPKNTGSQGRSSYFSCDSC
jgi:hypothetical protein